MVFKKDPGPYLAVCPVSHTGEKHSPSSWRMSNAIMSWSWEGYEGHKADVEVYARAASVELFVNGRSVGKKAMGSSCLARFRCTYQPGTVEVAAYDSTGRELGRYALRSAGRETCLTARAEQPTVQKGHLSYIRLAYTDAQGTVKSSLRGRLRVRVSGGELLALGSACPYNELGFGGTDTDTYYGEALAIVRAEGESVELTVTDGMLSGSVSVPVV